MLARLRRQLREWYACHVSRRCEYYSNYLAFGPPDLTHAGFHHAEAHARKHFDHCTWTERKQVPCPTCAEWEARLRV